MITKLLQCSGSYKHGKGACNTRGFPKDKLERLVIDQIKEQVLTQECLEDLVKLVNEELDSAHVVLKDKMDAIDAELGDVKLRLSKLYDALETRRLNLDDFGLGSDIALRLLLSGVTGAPLFDSAFCLHFIAVYCVAPSKPALLLFPLAFP